MRIFSQRWSLLRGDLKTQWQKAKSPFSFIPIFLGLVPTAKSHQNHSALAQSRELMMAQSRRQNQEDKRRGAVCRSSMY